MKGPQKALVVDHRNGGVDASDLPSLTLGQNLNLTTNDLAYIRSQGITVDADNNSYPENIPYQVPQHVNPFELEYRSNYLINFIQQFTQHLCSFQNVSGGGGENGKVGDIYFSFSAEYLEELLISETNRLLEHSMEPVKLVWRI